MKLKLIKVNQFNFKKIEIKKNKYKIKKQIK